ncbi:MAG: ABC transporter ATP-binding protein [Cellulosilyticaceae bacterium]
MLEIKNVSVAYESKGEQVQIVGPIDLNIQQGEIVVLIGPSGCGKSTLLKVLGGIQTGYEGSVAFNQAPINYGKDAIGYIPQGYGLLQWKTVYQNCVLPYKVKGIKITEQMKDDIQGLLQELGIADLGKRYPVTLSGGQKQRVAIARAFSFAPSIVLMDEPFSALDAIIKEDAIALFLDIWKKHGCTSLVVTHSIEEALYMGTKIIVMSHAPGRIIKSIENPLFGKKAFREEPAFKALYNNIKNCMKEGDGYAD